MDLMNCQMCGGSALQDYETENEESYGAAWVYCAGNCGMRGKRVSSKETDLMEMDEFERFSEAHEGYRPDEFEARAAWNEMQGYIARGKLLDAATSCGRGRL